MNLQCCTCGAWLTNPMGFPLRELESLARLTGWIVTATDAECPACIGKAVEKVERNVSKEAANAK